MHFWRKFFISFVIGVTLVPVTSQAGNYVKLHVRSDHEAFGFRFFRSPGLATDFPQLFHATGNFSQWFEFDDRSTRQDNYIIIRFSASYSGNDICDVEITPANYNRGVKQVEVKNLSNPDGRQCSVSRIGMDYELLVTSRT